MNRLFLQILSNKDDYFFDNDRIEGKKICLITNNTKKTIRTYEKIYTILNIYYTN